MTTSFKEILPNLREIDKSKVKEGLTVFCRMSQSLKTVKSSSSNKNTVSLKEVIRYPYLFFEYFGDELN